MATQLAQEPVVTPPAANPAGLSVEQLAQLLGVGDQMIREHLARGRRWAQTGLLTVAMVGAGPLPQATELGRLVRSGDGRIH